MRPLARPRERRRASLCENCAVAAQAEWKPARDTWRNVPCPLCGGQRFDTLATTDRYDMDLVTAGCTQCGLVMTNPQPDERALDAFYRDHYRHYYQKTDTPSEAYIREFRKDERAATTAQFLRSQGLLFPDAAVLDIGASEGCILKAIADLEPAHVCKAEDTCRNPGGGIYRLRE